MPSQVEYHYDLGSHSWPQTGLSEEGQQWFDRGLLWCYGYNHLESVRCYQKCAALHPDAAMPLWGAAYAWGPNYNAPWETINDERLRRLREEALAVVSLAQTPLEKALAKALLLRYPQASKNGANTQQWNAAFADAMVRIADNHPDCVDLQALAAEALMTITPWSLWDLQSGEPAPLPGKTQKALDMLESAFELVQSRGDTPHPLVGHLLAHLLEMSPFPERALLACDALVAHCHDTGHLTHMATHIYIQCGDYFGAMHWNIEASKVDRAFLEREGKSSFYTVYAAHNLHFKMYAAMFMGHFGHAIEAARELEQLLPETLLRSNTPAGFPFINVADALLATRYHVWVRFGKWDDILAHPLPIDTDLYCVTTCTAHYARSLAHALGAEDMVKAEHEHALFEIAFSKIPVDWNGIPGFGRRLHNNTCHDILRVSRKLLEGELAYRHGQIDEAFSLLEEAGRLEAAQPAGLLVYDEPWGFMQPTRHALGALLLEKRRFNEAEKVYREDLGLTQGVPRPFWHVDNVWALHGLCEALHCQGKKDIALEHRLRLVAARADIEIFASCFCRRRCCKDDDSIGAASERVLAGETQSTVTNCCKL